MIKYPRQCNHCNYISNNPAMHHYHMKVHELIPEGTLCDHGCGNKAKYRNTGGKYTCEKIAHHCPNYIKTHSARIKKQWECAYERKEKTKEIFLKHCVENEQAREKSKTSIKSKWGNFTPEQVKEYRHYARRIRQRAQRWAKEQGYILGQQTYHVDHKLSILDAWNANLTEEIVNHPINLQIVEAKTNTSKGSKSILSVEELLIKINALCERAEQNDA